jgi:hypothetical protein
MIVESAVDAEDQAKLDYLAYGIAATGRQLQKLVANSNIDSHLAENLKFTHTNEGFSTLS